MLRVPLEKNMKIEGLQMLVNRQKQKPIFDRRERHVKIDAIEKVHETKLRMYT